MRLCRFQDQGEPRVGLVGEDAMVLDLAAAGVTRMLPLLESSDPLSELRKIAGKNLPRRPLAELRLCPPIEQQEIWAAGVTYLRSKTARMEESEFSATAYDRVYEAERPELFFKSMPEKAAGPADAVGIRKDARWSVPEPELALVINSRGKVVGYTIGNDMSSRDIEGENLLYLPQAKIYTGSCALGPWIRIGPTESEARQWTISLKIVRKGKTLFEGETSVGRIKRTFDELAAFLFRSQAFSNGAVLLTGTGVVPPDQFTLEAGDEVEISVSGIGKLRNVVKMV